MKHTVHLISIILVTGMAAAAQPTSPSWVRVKVMEPMQQKVASIHFVLRNGHTASKIYAVRGDSGIFLAQLNVTHATDILWGYREGLALPLIVSPYDTLQITIVSEKDGILFGKRARTCANLVDMYASSNRPRVQVYRHEYKESPSEFVDFMNERLNNHLRFANTFCEGTKCTKTFVTWYIKSAYVSYYRNLADYVAHWEAQSQAGKTTSHQFERVREMVLRNVDLTDASLEMSSGYYDLLKTLFFLYIPARELERLYQQTFSGALLQRGNLTASQQAALTRITEGTFNERDLNTFSQLTNKHRQTARQEVWPLIDQPVQEMLASVKDPVMREVLFNYYKGIARAI
jgi:hypothetical protein